MKLFNMLSPEARAEVLKERQLLVSRTPAEIAMAALMAKLRRSR
jgi:hypothetical protein